MVDEFLVEFSGPDDPDNPKSWTPRRRWIITLTVGLLVFTVTFASSIFSVNIGIVKDKFHVTQVVATLGVALFVLVRSPVLRPVLHTKNWNTDPPAGLRIWAHCIRTHV